MTTAYASAAFEDKTVATNKTVNVVEITVSGPDAGNYTYNTTASTTADITAATLTVSATGIDKVYDATTNATVSLSDDRVAADDVSASYTEASFDDKNVGTDKPVSVSGIAVTGADATNYTFNTTATSTANITVRPITVTAATDTKEYDGTTDSAGTPTITTGSLGADDSATWTQSFDTRNAGTGKTLTPAGVVNDGNSGNNYSYTFVNDTTGVINARPISVTANTNTKTYDAATSAAALPTVTSGTLQGSDTPGFSESYDTKDVGTGKTLTPAGVVNDGNSGNNYSYTFVNDTTGVINARPITVTAITNTKTYDATTSAAALPTVTLGTLQGSDTPGFSESYDTKDVGTGKTLTPAGVVNDGNSGNNYSYTFLNDTTGVINARPISVTANTNTKAYDTTTSAAALPTVSSGSLQGSDTPNFSETYDTKDVGTGKTLTPAGVVNDGNSGNNYSYTFVNDTTGVITAHALLVSATGINRVYDGTTNATVTLSDNRQPNDNVTTAYASAAFEDKTVATNKTVNVVEITVSGPDAGNYTYNTTASTTADITAATLTVSATGIDKVYDATTNATVSLSDDRVAGDDVSASYTEASFEDKNVGTDKPVSVSGIAVTGADATNYTFNTTASSTANITAKGLTVKADDKSRAYGSGNPPLTASYSGFVAGENEGVLSGSPDLSTTATIDSGVGTFPITVTQGTLGAINYAFSFSNGTLTVNCANITLSPVAFVNGRTNVAYSQSITAGGGGAPYDFAVTIGSLPEGLTLSGDGTLSGTPTTTGTNTFTVTATDTNGCTGSQSYSLRITPPCPDITFSPALFLLPFGRTNSAYIQTISADGGVEPYTFVLASGSLPAGLTLSPGGVISGTPTTIGANNFTIMVSDDNGCSGLIAYELQITGPCTDNTAPAAPVFTFPKLGKPLVASVTPEPGHDDGKNRG